MKLPQILRISVALALIFAAGVLIGRYTAPQSPVALGPAGRGPDNVLARLTTELGLDAGQKTKMKEVVDDMSDQMASFPPASPERREVFRNGVPRMRTILRPDQFAAFDRYVEMTDRRISRVIRRREAVNPR